MGSSALFSPLAPPVIWAAAHFSIFSSNWASLAKSRAFYIEARLLSIPAASMKRMKHKENIDG
jgi:hypothetical protein